MNSVDSTQRTFTRFAAFCLLLATLVVGVVIGLASSGLGESAPECPTEDSCSISYSDGHWTISEDNS